MKVFVPPGQSTTPLCIQANDKFQMVSDLGSFSFNSGLAQNQLLNNMGVYIQQSGNDMSKNQNCMLSLQCTNNSGAQTSQALTLASGHINVGQGMQNYSLLYNKAPDGVQQNLQISGGTPQTDPTINLYSTSFAGTYGFPSPIVFTSKTGYSATTAITDANQFTSKAYVDSSVSALSTVYQPQSAMSSYVTTASLTTNYNTKT